MICPTVAADRALWVVALLRRWIPAVRDAHPSMSYADAAALIVAAANEALASGRDIASVIASKLA